MRLRPRHLTRLPAAEDDLAVLHRWGLMRCDAVQMGPVSTELSKLMAEDAGPPADQSDLVEWICEQYHPAQEIRLEEAIAIATRVETIHRKDDAWPHGLTDQLIHILDRMFAHQQREQAVVFPMLLQGTAALPASTVDEMIAAHDTLRAEWGIVQQVTQQFTVPGHACAAWRLLYVLCRKLQFDWEEQSGLENRMLLAARFRPHPV